MEKRLQLERANTELRREVVHLKGELERRSSDNETTAQLKAAQHELEVQLATKDSELQASQERIVKLMETVRAQALAKHHATLAAMEVSIANPNPALLIEL